MVPDDPIQTVIAVEDLQGNCVDLGLRLPGANRNALPSQRADLG
jgi:hypothetical protein